MHTWMRDKRTPKDVCGEANIMYDNFLHSARVIVQLPSVLSSLFSSRRNCAFFMMQTPPKEKQYELF